MIKYKYTGPETLLILIEISMRYLGLHPFGVAKTNLDLLLVLPRRPATRFRQIQKERNK